MVGGAGGGRGRGRGRGAGCAEGPSREKKRKQMTNWRHLNSYMTSAAQAVRAGTSCNPFGRWLCSD